MIFQWLEICFQNVARKALSATFVCKPNARPLRIEAMSARARGSGGGGVVASLNKYVRRLVKCGQRRKRWDAIALLHSEWSCRLGICTLLSIALATTLALTYYVMLPHLFAEHLRAAENSDASTSDTPPPIVAFGIAALLIILSTHQLTWVMHRMPRNCALYNFVYANYGQAVAFFVAWSQLHDATSLAAFLSHAYVDHFRLLFYGTIDGGRNNDVSPFGASRSYRYLRPSTSALATSKLLERLEKTLKTTGTTNSSAPLLQTAITATTDVDWLCVALIVAAGLVMVCSLRILLTVTVIFLITALFTSTSTTIVALLHNLPELRVNHVGDNFSRLFAQTVANTSHFLLGFLAIELLGYVGEECEEPRVALPLAARYSMHATLGIVLFAFLSFFPFVYRMRDASIGTYEQPIPIVFNSIGVYSARYLMNVGAMCALSAALLCALLSVTRLLATLGTDSLLPLSAHLRQLHGKGGAPRGSVVAGVVFVSWLATVNSRTSMFALLPLNLCLRLCFMAIAVYAMLFRVDNDDNADSVSQQQYERLRHCRHNSTWKEKEKRKRRLDGLLLVKSSTSLSSSASSSNASSTCASSDTDDDDGAIDKMHLLERVWRLANCENDSCNGNECRGLLERYTGAPATVRLCTTDNQLGLTRGHNCLRSPCASSYTHASSTPLGTLQRASNNFHIYESVVPDGLPLCVRLFPQREFSLQRFGRAGVRGVKEREQSAHRTVAVFLVISALVAVAHTILWKTVGHVPLLAAISCALGVLFLAATAYHVFSLSAESDQERAFAGVMPSVAGCRGKEYGSINVTPAVTITADSSATTTTTFVAATFANGTASGDTRWLAVGCLATLFIVPQLLGHFVPTHYLQLILYYFIGALLYLTRLCRQTKRKVRL